MKKIAKNRNLVSENGNLLRWDDARVFLAIARTGSLSGAATARGMGIATVSRQIERLEAALGLTLFSRHQNGYRLTDDGTALLAKAETLEQAADAFAEGSSAQEQIAGRVRLATAETLASHVIAPALPLLVKQFPALTIDIVTDVEAVNLHRRDADLAIRMVKPERGNVTIRRLGALGFGLYCSARYVEERRQEEDGTEFGGDRFIAWCDAYGHLASAQWTERVLQGRPPTLTTTTLSAQLHAAIAGVGLAILPHFLARQHDLVCLKSALGIDQEIWLAMNSDLAQSRRVRVVSDFLIDLVQRSKVALETSTTD